MRPPSKDYSCLSLFVIYYLCVTSYYFLLVFQISCILGVDPALDALTGGRVVTIYGTNFAHDVTVYIGTAQVQAANITWLNSSAVSVVLPPQPLTDYYNITVYNTMAPQFSDTVCKDRQLMLTMLVFYLWL